MEVIDLDELLDTAYKGMKQMNIPPSDNKFSLKEMIHFLVSFAVIVAGALFIVAFIGQRTQVNGNSMKNTLYDKDNLIVDKITYRFTDPKRFDIVVFPHTNSEGKEIYYIKRVIGLPGETVQISEGTIFINNVPLEEDYGCEEILEGKLAASPVTLEEDEYFVLGDNRNHSSDSREIGPVNKKIILGRAVFRIYPFSRFGTI